MDTNTIILLFYVFFPPLAALLFAGVIMFDNRRRSRKLDAEIAAYRAREADEQRWEMEKLIAKGL